MVYVFVEKAVLWISMSGKNHNCFESPLSVWTNPTTKPPEHLCLLNKLLQLVPVLVLTWSSYMIGDCNFDLSFPWCLHHVCLSLIHVGIHANKLLIKAQPIRNLRTPASTAMNKMGFLEQASLTLSPQSPSFFPSSLFPTPFDAWYAG